MKIPKPEQLAAFDADAERVAAIAERYFRDGRSLPEIAAERGVFRMTVSRWLRRHGYRPRRGYPTRQFLRQRRLGDDDVAEVLEQLRGVAVRRWGT